MQRSSKSGKPVYQKENQQKLVNKKIDLLTSLHNIKLPLQHSQSLKDNQFKSVPSCEINNFQYPGLQKINSYRQSKAIKSNRPTNITEEYCQSYGLHIESALKKEPTKGKFLTNHKIDGVLRARMLDWMVQVISSYHFQNKTYFSGVQVMDRYFANCPEVLVPNQLHIIGVQSMFIASKMEQVYPLKMKTVYQKIAHKKILISQLTQMQSKIVQQLNFCLVTSSIYDLAITKIVRHLIAQDLYSENLIKQIQNLCSLIGKMVYYNYQLISSYDKQTLSLSLANFVLEIYKLDPLRQFIIQQKECKKDIKETLCSFKKKFKGLNNIFKFAQKNVLEIVQSLI